MDQVSYFSFALFYLPVHVILYLMPRYRTSHTSKMIHSSSLHSISFSLWKHGAGFLCFYLWQWSVNTKNYWLFSFLYTMQLYSNLVMPNNKIFIIISHTCILRNNSHRNKMTFLWCWRITLPPSLRLHKTVHIADLFIMSSSLQAPFVQLVFSLWPFNKTTLNY